MIWVILTVICYTISSLGDKYISAKLNCTPSEFTFLVSAATAFWIACMIPFTGWHIKLSFVMLGQIVLITGTKICEFYSSAILLKSVSAYELKTWLGINIVLSYVCNWIQGKSEGKMMMSVWSLFLFAGIVMIVRENKNEESPWRHVLLCCVFVLSKLFYGLIMGFAARDSEKTSLLLIIMVIIAALQFPRVHIKKLLRKSGITGAVATRIPNAGGLLFEAMAATENIFLYALIQPVQLLLLFITSILRKEKMGKIKIVGSLVCIVSIFMIAIWQ